ncbi:HNH endonuclease [Lewinella sp. LCG006]|uniref:HNH endonuclease n=1 Tax=Lewinella sp. LCG006 TaxID=3231911 RepID=UPI003460CA56
MPKINLDALVPREDFEIIGNNSTSAQIQSLSVNDLSNQFIYQILRKPDFQRETNEWDSKKIYEFIDSFIEGDLIPSIILWRSQSGLIFVIDGAHRLSALISWIYDDYGDGEISKKFYENNIIDDQLIFAEKTRNLINKKIGSFQEIKNASKENNSHQEHIRRANNTGVNAIQVQWVVGDAKKAENSFFKINQKASKIDPTELKLLESRKKPNCISARAIIRAGKGHKYWSNFSAENQNSIQQLASEINRIFFTPQLRTPVKTMDIPIGGKVSSAQTLPLILEFINQVNHIPVDFKDTLSDDIDGMSTISHLRNARKIAWRLNSVHPSSLGLHPIVYFYSKEGKYKTASFYAITNFILELIKKNKLNDFINAREEFEKFLIEYDYVATQINRKYRSALKGLPYVTKFNIDMVDKINSGKNYKESIKELLELSDYDFITLFEEKDEMSFYRRNFDTDSKSAVFIREALQNGIKCKICNGFIHSNSITIDHIDRKEDGGLGNPDNGQLAHPYCNTTYKN